MSSNYLDLEDAQQSYVSQEVVVACIVLLAVLVVVYLWSVEGLVGIGQDIDYGYPANVYYPSDEDIITSLEQTNAIKNLSIIENTS